MKKDKPQKHRTSRSLTLKLALLVLGLISAAEISTFTATIVIDMVGGGSSNTVGVISMVISSIFIGGLLSFLVGNIVLRPLSNLIAATQKVSKGDYTSKLDITWNEKHTVKELNELINAFNEMTAELSANEMFKKDFIANFSHEFKTPLASICGFARQLHEGNLTPEQQREFSKIILDEAQFLSELSSNTLLLTNLENKDIVSDKTVFSLDEQLRSCMLHLEPQWSDKNIEIDMDLDEVKFCWNEQLLAHVWNNLFDNAVKFTPDGGNISVSCKHGGGVITIRVRDSGCGISPNSLPHIFEKFYQEDASRSTKGNGLGLSLVKRIIHLCNGRISVHSKENSGTEFTVILYEDENRPGDALKSKRTV